MRSAITEMFSRVKVLLKKKRLACGKLTSVGDRVRLHGALYLWVSIALASKSRKRAVVNIILKRGGRERLSLALSIMKRRVFFGRKLGSLLSIREAWISRERERLKCSALVSEGGAYKRWKLKWSNWIEVERLKSLKAEKHEKTVLLKKAFFGWQMLTQV